MQVWGSAVPHDSRSPVIWSSISRAHDNACEAATSSPTCGSESWPPASWQSTAAAMTEVASSLMSEWVAKVTEKSYSAGRPRSTRSSSVTWPAKYSKPPGLPSYAHGKNPENVATSKSRRAPLGTPHHEWPSPSGQESASSRERDRRSDRRTQSEHSTKPFVRRSVRESGGWRPFASTGLLLRRYEPCVPGVPGNVVGADGVGAGEGAGATAAGFDGTTGAGTGIVTTLESSAPTMSAFCFLPMV